MHTRFRWIETLRKRHPDRCLRFSTFDFLVYWLKKEHFCNQKTKYLFTAVYQRKSTTLTCGKYGSWNRQICWAALLQITKKGNVSRKWTVNQSHCAWSCLATWQKGLNKKACISWESGDDHTSHGQAWIPPSLWISNEYLWILEDYPSLDVFMGL